MALFRLDVPTFKVTQSDYSIRYFNFSALRSNWRHQLFCPWQARCDPQVKMLFVYIDHIGREDKLI